MPFQLVIIKGRSATQTLPLPTDGVATVGRQQGCQIRIGSSQVSRKHCELFEKQGQLFVKDLNSSNGTFVNGQKVQGGQQTLEPGNVLLIGGVSFRVEQVSASAAAGAAVDVAGEADIDFEVVSDDLTISEPAPAAKPSPAAKPASVPTAAEKAPAAPAEAPEKAPAEEDEFAVPMADQPAEIGEDAVADYLLNIDLDDEDKV